MFSLAYSFFELYQLIFDCINHYKLLLLYDMSFILAVLFLFYFYLFEAIQVDVLNMYTRNTSGELSRHSLTLQKYLYIT